MAGGLRTAGQAARRVRRGLAGSRGGRGLVLGAVAGAAAFVVSEAARPRGGRGRLLDWDEIAELARSRLGASEDMSSAAAARTTELYRKLAAEVESPLLETLGGLPDRARLPRFDVLGRRAWVDLNVRILRRATEPLFETHAGSVPNTLLVDLGRAGVDRYVAFLLGYLARRVLGQYDPQLLGREPIGADGLYLVEPNVAAWEERADLPPAQLRRWLILHEMTHAWQFAAHPWLRGHMDSMLRELMALGEARDDPLSRVLSMTVGLRSQWRVARRIQAVMSLVEGYGNLAMNLVGRRLLPDFDRLETAYRERGDHRKPLEILLFKVTGLGLKMQQYEVGERFARTVLEAHGMAALNRAWSGPEALPTIEELGDPEAWYRRTSGTA
ncbi:MAG: zinc-dependent metalloprotease [Candidatus Dormibacteraceae bacterium]